jgi:hypothetical protein
MVRDTLTASRLPGGSVFTFDSSQDGAASVKFGKDRREALVNLLQKEHSQAISDRAGLEKNWKLWLQQANSRRKRPDARGRDSKLDMPFTRRRIQQNAARLLNPVFQQDRLMVAKASFPQYHEFALALEGFMEYITGKVPLQEISEDWVEQFQIFNVGIVKTPFVRKQKHVKQWKEIGYEEYAQLKEEGYPGLSKREYKDKTVPAKYFIEEDKTVTTFVGADVQLVPIEDFICPITTADIESADWVSHRVWLTRAAVEERIKRGIYDEKDGDQKVLDLLGKPSSERKKLLDHSTTRDDGDRGVGPSSRQYEICETYIAFDYEGKGTRREIVVTWDRKSGAILRCVDNPYHNYCRPFVAHHYKRVHGSIYGIPATYLLEPLHVANSASFNQRLDAASKANEKIMCGPPGSCDEMKAVFDRNGLTGGFYETTAAKDEIFEMTLSQPFTQLDTLEAQFERQGDELMHLGPYSWGNEQVQRPTATGQVTLVEESKQPQFMQLERFRRSFALVVMHMISRYRQFYPEGAQYFIEAIDPEARQALEVVTIQWPEEAIEESVIVETKVTSAQMSKQLRKQEVVAMLDRVPQLYNTMMQMAQGAMSGGPGAMMALKMLHGMQTLVDAFLTEFEVPKKDQLNPDLVQEAQVAQMVQQQMQALSQQVQTLQAQLAQAQPPAGAPPGGPMGQQAGPQPGVQGPAPMGMAGA